MKLVLRALPLLILYCLIEAKQKDFYTFKVVNSRGRLVSLEKYRGSVSLALFWTDSLTNGPVHAGHLKQNFTFSLIYLLDFTPLSPPPPVPGACTLLFPAFPVH